MRLIAGILLLSLAISPAALAKSGGGHSSHSSKSSSSKSGKTEHVAGYTRSDGTYVHDYDRHVAGTPTASRASVPYRRGHLASGYTYHPTVQRDSHGRIKRSSAAKAAFKRERPCPATGRSSGRCPGYVIDHVRALECGGADAPANMQWQTVAAGKAKDRTERLCR